MIVYVYLLLDSNGAIKTTTQVYSKNSTKLTIPITVQLMLCTNIINNNNIVF